MTFVLFRYIPRSGVEIEPVPIVLPIPLPHVLNLPIICEKLSQKNKFNHRSEKIQKQRKAVK